MKRLLLLLCGLALAGCATIVEGTHQDITVNTNPPGAHCVLRRHGESIGEIGSTPGTVKIEKTKYDMNIVCNKTGYEEATYFNKSDLAAATMGNIVTGHIIGRAIDSATGADNKYTTPVNITLVPQGASGRKIEMKKAAEADSGNTESK